jgi:DNA mismatch repair protein MSH5
MSKIIDFKETQSSNRVTILPGVSEELDDKKQTYQNMDHFLTLVADQEASSLPDDFPAFNIVYFPQLGYLIVVARMEENEYYPEVDGLQFHVSSEI